MAVKKDVSKAKDYYKDLIEYSGDAVVVLDNEGRVLSWDKRAEEIFGFKTKEVLDKRLPFLKEEEIRSYVDIILGGGVIKNLVINSKRKGESEVHALMTMIPNKNSEKKIATLTLLFKDITDLKKVELMKSEFLSMLSHELRTPLSQICGFSEILIETIYGPINSEQKDALKVILKQGQHLTSLINSILWFSGVETGEQIKLKKTPVSFESLINEASEPLREDFKEKNISISVKAEGKDTSVAVDIDQMEKVVFNILENALKFNHPGGAVEITVQKKDNCIVASFKDNGIGLAEENLEKIFEKFFRVDVGSTRLTEGIGMGLAVAKAIVKVHNGKIWAASKGLGQGSSFYIELPLE